MFKVNEFKDLGTLKYRSNNTKLQLYFHQPVKKVTKII